MEHQFHCNYAMEELIPLVAGLARKYTGCDSSSVTYEKAQELMEAVLYCLEICQVSGTDALRHQNLSVREQYELGAKLVQEKAAAVRNSFNTLAPGFDDYNVHCLRDAVRRNIPLFLTEYDISFCPQDTIITLDYPILTDCSALRGVSAVFGYLEALWTEQRFLSAFPREHVLSLLEKYDCEYPYMTENLCEIVLTNTIGHIAIRKALQDTGFREEEYQSLTELFGALSADGACHMIRQFTVRIAGQASPQDDALAAYLCLSAENIAARICNAALHGRLHRLFLI